MAVKIGSNYAVLYVDGGPVTDAELRQLVQSQNIQFCLNHDFVLEVVAGQRPIVDILTHPDEAFLRLSMRSV